MESCNHVGRMYLSTSIFMSFNAAIINVVTDDRYVPQFPQCPLYPRDGHENGVFVFYWKASKAIC